MRGEGGAEEDVTVPLYGLMMALFQGSAWHRDNTAAALLFSSEVSRSQL